jgi:hypothetical protein
VFLIDGWDFSSKLAANALLGSGAEQSQTNEGLGCQRKLFMACGSCGSKNQVDFRSETNIQFPGRKNFGTPSVLVFPTILVCLDCGHSQFNLPEAELLALRSGDAGSATR